MCWGPERSAGIQCFRPDSWQKPAWEAPKMVLHEVAIFDGRAYLMLTTSLPYPVPKDTQGQCDLNRHVSHTWLCNPGVAQSTGSWAHLVPTWRCFTTHDCAPRSLHSPSLCTCGDRNTTMWADQLRPHVVANLAATAGEQADCLEDRAERDAADAHQKPRDWGWPLAYCKHHRTSQGVAYFFVAKHASNRHGSLGIRRLCDLGRPSCDRGGTCFNSTVAGGCSKVAIFRPLLAFSCLFCIFCGRTNQLFCVFVLSCHTASHAVFSYSILFCTIKIYQIHGEAHRMNLHWKNVMCRGFSNWLL